MPKLELPEVPGVISAAEVMATIDAIASVQRPNGDIPWSDGNHTDPWNHVEAAMALDLGSRFADAERAYEWLERMQRPDGSWHAYYLDGNVKEQWLDTNVTAYVAVGVWHHYLCSGDTGFLEHFFPMVQRAIDFVLDHQHPTGEIEWDADPARTDGKGALLTGSSSIYKSVRCAIACANRLGELRPDWELSAGSLAIAVAHRPERFLDKARWAMDWYYPILGGALRGDAAHARIAAQWDTFVVPNRGVRCVSDQPWVTAAETCECVMALDAIGLHERAHQLFEWVQFLRADDGSYWTGANFDGEHWDLQGELYPVEQPTWNSAAVVLAANALGGNGPTSGLFRGEGLPAGLTAEELIDAGRAIEAENSRRADNADR